MNDPSAIQSRVRTLLAEAVGDHMAATPAAAPLEIDSFALVALVEAIEAEFGLRVRPADLVPAHFGSIAALVSFVSARTGALR